MKKISFHRFDRPVAWYLVRGIHDVMLVLNSSVNFLIYYVTGQNFRDEFMKVLKMLNCFKPEKM